ncbi:MAG: murein transglycosylase [Neisseriaceae bacterium]|nr:MAG: murein transglycosylase [Neisseriaceae bacterium]
MKKYTFITLFSIIAICTSGCSSNNKKQKITILEKPDTDYSSHFKPQPKASINTISRSRYSPNVTYSIVDYSHLPEWSNQYFEQSLLAFKRSCEVLINQPKWNYVCQVASRIKNTRKNAEQFFEEYFQPWVVTNNNGGLVGKVTGYYEPAILGSRTKSVQSPYPIYGIPYDFVSVPLPQNFINHQGTVTIHRTGTNSGIISPSGEYVANLSQFNITTKTKALKGRFSGNKFVPYYTRKEIYQGAIDDKAPILAYANDPVELFFLHIQGSGRIITENNQVIRLSYADKNEFPYKSVGSYMTKNGYIPLSSASMQRIKQYIQQHPDQMNEILGHNPSFIFFSSVAQTEENKGPIGALGVPLTNGYSGAVDKQYIDLGAPLFLATTDTRNGKALNRLIVAQDTGSAINGSVRVDFFWGYGTQAGEIAGKTNYPGYVWVLLPNGQYPM